MDQSVKMNSVVNSAGAGTEKKIASPARFPGSILEPAGIATRVLHFFFLPKTGDPTLLVFQSKKS